MTKLWEDTVVISLRDAQWLHCKDQRPKAVAPPSFLKMDGNAESSLGDVLFSSSAKFYLIEVKGTASDIASEWTGGASGDQKKGYIARWRIAGISWRMPPRGRMTRKLRGFSIFSPPHCHAICSPTGRSGF